MSFEAESQTVHDPDRRKASDTVSGFLASLAIFTSLIGIFWHPLRLIIPALVLALVSSGMASGKGRLQRASVLIGGVCLFLGLALAVATSHALF